MIKRQKVQNCLCLFLLRNTVYLKEGHHNHTSPATSDSCSEWILEKKQWRNIENIGIILSYDLTGSSCSTLHPSLPGPGRAGLPGCCISSARPGCIIVPCYWLCWSAGLLPACCSACQLFVYLAITPCKPWSFLNTRTGRGFIYEESELLNFEC